VSSLFRLMHLDRFIEGEGTDTVTDGPSISL
jgi:hypothetical protein